MTATYHKTAVVQFTDLQNTSTTNTIHKLPVSHPVCLITDMRRETRARHMFNYSTVVTKQLALLGVSKRINAHVRRFRCCCYWTHCTILPKLALHIFVFLVLSMTFDLHKPLVDSTETHRIFIHQVVDKNYHTCNSYNIGRLTYFFLRIRFADIRGLKSGVCVRRILNTVLMLKRPILRAFGAIGRPFVFTQCPERTLSANEYNHRRQQFKHHKGSDRELFKHFHISEAWFTVMIWRPLKFAFSVLLQNCYDE